MNEVDISDAMTKVIPVLYPLANGNFYEFPII